MPRKYKPRMPKQVIQKKVMNLTKDVNNLKKASEVHRHPESFTGMALAYDVDNKTVCLDPAQGDTPITRTGDEIAPYRFKFKGTIRYNAASTVPTTCRFILLQSKDGYVPVVNSVANTTRLFQTGGTNLSVFSPLDETNRKKYVLLYDKTFTVDSSKHQAVINIDKKISRKTVFLDGGSTTAAKGQIYLCRLSDVNTNTPTFSGISTIYYKD